MRHLKAGKKLGRNAEHRRALYRNLALALFRHERIITTLPKAKAVRPFVEKLITLARKGGLHNYRLVLSRLGPSSLAEVDPEGDENADHRRVVQKLFEDIGPRFKERPGGYTRIIKRHERRLGDAGETAYLELLKEGETKKKVKAAAPAPRVTEEPMEETPATSEAAPPAEQPQAEAPAAEGQQPTGEQPKP